MPTPNADRLEAELHAPELEALAELCRVHGVAREDWPEHPGFVAFLDLAFARAVDRAKRTRRSRSRTAAFRHVGLDFGVRGDTVRRRWVRWEADYSASRKIRDKSAPIPLPNRGTLHHDNERTDDDTEQAA